ncbi:hypothetical protein HK104_005041 [Borealophlyctis nickersoniae]|nr:hypothetical protein HK104_005041 [Borealophlyctis nickersoniae]
MCNITRELKEQCAIQEKECEDLEADQSRAKGDVDALMKRIEILAGEKIVVQQKLEELKAENARLDAFLQTAKGGGPPIMEEAAAEKPAAATA